MRLAQHSITSGHTPRPMPSISAQRVTDTSLPANLLIPAHPSSCVQTVLCHPRPPPPVPPAVSSTPGDVVITRDPDAGRPDSAHHGTVVLHDGLARLLSPSSARGRGGGGREGGEGRRGGDLLSDLQPRGAVLLAPRVHCSAEALPVPPPPASWTGAASPGHLY